MPRLVRALLPVAMLLAAVVPIAAQVQTGSILVRVSDEQNAGVPGVAITLTSTALVAGTRRV